MSNSPAALHGGHGPGANIGTIDTPKGTGIAIAPAPTPAIATEVAPIQEPCDGFWKRVTLLESTPRSGRTLHSGRIHLFGTAHISKESCDDVLSLVNQVQPDVVFVELCSARRVMLQPPPPPGTGVPTLQDVLTGISNGGNTFALLYEWYGKTMGGQLDAGFGQEFRVAAEAGAQYSAKVLLGDRPVHITIARAWGSFSPLDKFRFVCQLLYSALFSSKSELQSFLQDAKSNDNLTEAILELGLSFPTLKTTLLDERDLFMTFQLQNCITAGVGKNVVAVVGACHVPGITRYWKDIDSGELAPITDDEVQAVLKIPSPPSPGAKALTVSLFVGVPALIATVLGVVALYGVKLIRRARHL